MKLFSFKIDLAFIIVNFIFILTYFVLFTSMLCIYKDNLHISNILLIIFIFIFYFGINIFYIIKSKTLKKTNELLEEAHLHNKTLQSLYDNIRTFRHDFFNIMQSIDGYIKTGDKSALEKYYGEIKLECDNLNSLSVLDPNLIDDSAIYNLITSKFYKAEKLGISFEIHILLKFSTLNINSYAFSRILGILLDNAIEAAEKSIDKKITLEIVPIPCFDNSKQIANIVIENSCTSEEIDLSRICEKGYTSKSFDTRFPWSWLMES